MKKRIAIVLLSFLAGFPIATKAQEPGVVDVVTLKDGKGVLKGIITKQAPGEEITVAIAGSAALTEKYADIVKLSKAPNPYRGGQRDGLPAIEPPVLKVREPELTGGCFWLKDRNLIIPLEEQTYTRGTRTPSLYLLEGNLTSDIRMPLGTEVKLLARVENNELPSTGQIYIFKLGVDKGAKKRSIDTRAYPFLLSGTTGGEAQAVAFEGNKAGAHSFEITFLLTGPGEYAVYVKGSGNTFSLFGAGN